MSGPGHVKKNLLTSFNFQKVTYTGAIDMISGIKLKACRNLTAMMATVVHVVNCCRDNITLLIKANLYGKILKY